MLDMVHEKVSGFVRHCVFSFRAEEANYSLLGSGISSFQISYFHLGQASYFVRCWNSGALYIDQYGTFDNFSVFIRQYALKRSENGTVGRCLVEKTAHISQSLSSSATCRPYDNYDWLPQAPTAHGYDFGRSA